MTVLTRWVLDPESESHPRDERDFGEAEDEGDYLIPELPIVQDRLGLKEQNLGEGMDKVPWADPPFGGWLLEGPGIALTKISLIDPQVPNFELMAKVLFTLKIVHVSVSF